MLQKIKFKRGILKIYFLAQILILFVIILSQPVFASRIDDLRQKINDNNTQIAEIQKEIEELQKQLDKTGKDAKTLKNQISQLETTIKNLKANINLTGRKIAVTNLNIEELNLEIESKEGEIAKSKKVLAETIRNINEAESKSLVEILLANASFSDFYGDLGRMKNFQETININLKQLKELKNDLQNQEAAKEAEKKELENLRSKLADQKKITEAQNSQKNTLLKETQNRESLYKKQLAEQLAKQQALEDEISAYEEQIRIEINPSSLPKTGSGVLSWPIDPPIVITQYFGNTPFATQNPQVYGGKGHPGIDLRASIGAPIKTARQGAITAINNVISFCRGYQIGYGKWILIKHDNNLSTFYSHLSLIKVSTGDVVEKGQLIGYSGDTGYTEGPHLHFGVFATQAIDSLEYKSASQTCGNIIMRQPLVAPSGYLNPLSYL
jgi:murein DD-endopeptidase MepM/ murein hydrolase activator NlpD